MSLRHPMPETSSRRQFLRAAALCAPVVSLTRNARTQNMPQPSSLGLVTYTLGIQQKARAIQGKDLSDPLVAIEHCRLLGAGGIQFSLGIRDAEYLRRLRQAAESQAIRIEAIFDLPADRAGMDRLEKQMQTAQAAGAGIGRVVIMPGRRYEQFSSFEEFAAASRAAMKSLQMAEPLAAKYRLQLAVENHKDHRIDERLNQLKQLSSEYIGMCVDVGNSFALCEDPMDVVQAYAPWALTVHLKDQAVRPCESGFLLADVPLGSGFLDLPAMVRILRQARPAVTFNLELITRDPLCVPVLTERYWVTLPGVPGADLARTLRTVHAKASRDPFVQVSSLPIEQQAELEIRNIKQSLSYAQQRLGL